MQTAFRLSFTRACAVAFSAAALLLPCAASAQQFIVSTVAGSPTVSGYTGDGGAATAGTFSGPIAIAADGKGNYYVADYTNQVVRKVSSTGIITTFAGTGTIGYAGDGGPATSAQLSTVHGLAVDAAGQVYISDTGNAVIRKVDLNGNITTFAGTGVRGFAGNGGQAINAQFISPAGLSFDANGNLYVADVGDGTVRVISPSGKISAFAGNGFSGFGAIVGEGGPSFNAVLSLPYAVAADSAGNVFIGDVGASAIAKVGTDGHINTVLTQVSAGSMAADRFGNVYFADYHRNIIGRIGSDGSISTVAGDGSASFNGDGSPAQFAEFDQPYGVASDPSGKLYVAEFGNQDVRLLSPIAAGTVFAANGASNLGASGSTPIAVAPGEIVTLFGAGLADTAKGTPDANGNLPTLLGGTTVTVNGVPAPIIATSPSRVSVVVPASTSGDQAQFVVTYQGGVVGTAANRIFGALPGIFTPSSAAIATLGVQNSDGSVNAIGNAAPESSTITAFVTGVGPYSPGIGEGQVATSSKPVKTSFPLTVLINGENATISSVQTVAGQPGSVLQVVVTLPPDVTTSNTVSLQVKASTLASQAATIAVQ